MVSAAFASRPVKKLVLFDVDGTLSLARQVNFHFLFRASQELPCQLAVRLARDARNPPSPPPKARHRLRRRLRSQQDLRAAREQRYALWYSRGSLPTEILTPAIHDFDYAFSENGLTAYKLGEPLPSQSFIDFIGEERYKSLVKFILHYLADLDIPIKR